MPPLSWTITVPFEPAVPVLPPPTLKSPPLAVAADSDRPLLPPPPPIDCARTLTELFPDVTIVPVLMTVTLPPSPPLPPLPPTWLPSVPPLMFSAPERPPDPPPPPTLWAKIPTELFLLMVMVPVLVTFTSPPLPPLPPLPAFPPMVELEPPEPMLSVPEMTNPPA